MCVLLASDGAIVRNKGSEFVVLHEFFFCFHNKLTSQDYVYLFFLLLLLLSECHISKKNPKRTNQKTKITITSLFYDWKGSGHRCAIALSQESRNVDVFISKHRGKSCVSQANY